VFGLNNNFGIAKLYFRKTCRQSSILNCSMHLSGILGLNTNELFTSIKPIHLGKWSALGKNVTNLVNSTLQPKTIAAIKVDDVLAAIINA
jgi:hypothetical protein